MRLFGLEIRRAEKTLSAVPQRGWRHLIFEPFTGAWQQNAEEKRGDVLCYPTLYACLNRISQDIGKLPFLYRQFYANGIWKTIPPGDFRALFRNPNHYQNGQQFREAWMLSKLISGNTYVLKRRDERGVVNALYVLDPCRVMPLVSDSGDVYYQLYAERLAPLLGIDGATVTVPASEIIHDRLNTFHHQLIGVPPLCAAYWPAVKNLRILRSSSEFFANGARPGGILTAPQGLKDDEAAALKAYWDTNFTGQNTGKIAVLGADLKYQQLGEKAADSQMVEQMKYSDEQICQPFGIPPFKIGIGAIPAGLGVDAINQLYYADALQAHIESMEFLLDDGLGVIEPYGIELDLEPLLRMDEEKKAAVEGKLVGEGISTPNESRIKFGKWPLDGGDTVYMQQQNYSIAALNRRDSREFDQGSEVQATALNGAQVTSLQSLIAAAALGEIPIETARAAIAAAFPLLTQEQVDAMINPIQNPGPDEPEPEEARTMRADLYLLKAVQAARAEALQ